MPPNKCFGDNTIFLDFWGIVLDLLTNSRISVTKSGHPSNFRIFKNSVSESNNTNGSRSQKTSGRAQVAWIWSGHQHCLKRRTPTVSQLWHPTMHMPILHQNVLHGSQKEGEMNTTNTFSVCSDFFARWSTTMTNSFTLRSIHTVRSCDYLNLLLLLNMNMEHLK